mgnify:CR=1 FL=1
MQGRVGPVMHGLHLLNPKYTEQGSFQLAGQWHLDGVDPLDPLDRRHI